ncbi:hypothetical protein FWH09_03115, partial [Candidatus Saccharibacteria bacterium]|nr:hypothetical protein [Candidatus Saccharibacteria bacterium]
AVFGLVFFALDKAKDDLAGTWVCRDVADVTAAYGTQTFTFTSEGGISAALDADPTGNSFRGSFDVTRFNIDNRNRRYAVDVTFDEYLYDGEDILGLYVLPTTEWDIVIPRNNRNEMRINFEMGEAVVCGFEILN